jgi:hypothetical protein
MKKNLQNIVAYNFKHSSHIISQTEQLKTALVNHWGINSRVADNFAPLLSFYHFFIYDHTSSVVSAAGEYASQIKLFLAAQPAKKSASDAENCLNILLQSDISSSTDSGKKSAQQLIKEVIDGINIDSFEHSKTLSDYTKPAMQLARGGLALISKKEGDRVSVFLAVHLSSVAIQNALKNSSYAKSYASIIKSHSAVSDKQYRRPNNKDLSYVAGTNPTFCLLKLEEIMEVEFGDGLPKRGEG